MKVEEKALLSIGSGLVMFAVLTNPSVQKFILELLKELKEEPKKPCIFEERLCVKKPEAKKRVLK